jgi:hypothetical protein
MRKAVETDPPISWRGQSTERDMASGLKGFLGAWLLWLVALTLAGASLWHW